MCSLIQVVFNCPVYFVIYSLQIELGKGAKTWMENLTKIEEEKFGEFFPIHGMLLTSLSLSPRSWIIGSLCKGWSSQYTSTYGTDGSVTDTQLCYCGTVTVTEENISKWAWLWSSKTLFVEQIPGCLAMGCNLSSSVVAFISFHVAWRIETQK